MATIKASRVLGSILSLVYTLHRVLHVLLVFAWVSSMLSGFLLLSKILQIGRFAMRAHSECINGLNMSPTKQSNRL